MAEALRRPPKRGNESARQGGGAPCMAKREGMGSYRDFFRGEIISDLARGVPPQVIVSKMLTIAKNEKDPSALKAAGFQLLDKVGRQSNLGKVAYSQILSTVATVFSGLPEPARKNFQKLATEMLQAMIPLT